MYIYMSMSMYMYMCMIKHTCVCIYHIPHIYIYKCVSGSKPMAYAYVYYMYVCLYVYVYEYTYSYVYKTMYSHILPGFRVFYGSLRCLGRVRTALLRNISDCMFVACYKDSSNESSLKPFMPSFNNNQWLLNHTPVQFDRDQVVAQPQGAQIFIYAPPPPRPL